MPAKKKQPPQQPAANALSLNLSALADEILEKAQAKGVEHSYMFVTTFERYKDHISHLVALENAIKEKGTIVTKEYVKGRENIYVNPAITAYNQTAGAADKTAQLLLKCIVAPLGEEDAKDAFELF